VAAGAGGHAAVDIERAIDSLYQRPLGEFTAARNALVKTLPLSGAARVKKLTKPTPPAWMINQVYWHSRSVYQRLIEAGAALRTAQLDVLARGAAAQPRGETRGGRERPGSAPPPARAARDPLQEATENHRKAVADAVHQALRHAAAARLRPQPDSLSRSLEALSLSAAPPDPPGRLTDVIAPAGFEALSGVLVAAVAPAVATPDPPTEADNRSHQLDAADRLRQDEQRAALEQATAALAAARDAERAALARAEQAERSLRAAEATLETIRRELAAAHAAAGDAARARQAAEQALARAEAKVNF